MILFVDIGNQRIKWGVLLEGTFHFLGAFHHRNETMLSSLLKQHFSNVPKPQKIWIASVASIEVTRAVAEWFQGKWLIQAERFVVEGERPELSLAYHDPSRFGVDRWLALLGAAKEQSKYYLVIDCGTCVSFDAVSRAGHHQGGLILPGLQLMRDSIFQGTARCGEVSAESLLASKPSLPSLLGQNTADGIERGTLFSLLATISQLRNELTEEFQHEFSVFLTGGDAALLLPFIEIPVLYRPYLVFEGMISVINNKNFAEKPRIPSLPFELSVDCG